MLKAFFGCNFVPASKVNYLVSTVLHMGCIEVIESIHEVSIPYSHDGRLDVIEGTWEPTECERNAAWDMYVELVTRIPIAQVKPGESSLQVCLTSLYKLFDSTREILRKYGPSVARPRTEGQVSFGYLSVKVLDIILRPFLVKWYPMLIDYESSRKSSESSREHEKKWAKYDELNRGLVEVRDALIHYATLLARASEVPSLIFEEPYEE